MDAGLQKHSKTNGFSIGGTLARVLAGLAGCAAGCVAGWLDTRSKREFQSRFWVASPRFLKKKDATRRSRSRVLVFASPRLP